MFRKAIATALQFTFPVVLSRMLVSGKLDSGMGSFVVVNSDGWIVTAAHIFDQFNGMISTAAEVKKFRETEAAIRADASLTAGKQKKLLYDLKKPAGDAPEHCSAWWGADGLSITDVHVLPGMDLGVGRLDGFDPKMVTAYPLFKQPSHGIVQGVSLVKLGYPFHSITPLRDPATGIFSFPPGAMPPPSFPIEGILTRIIQGQSSVAAKHPLLWLETSSPGLRGQSGGPTIDEGGAVWAIQSQTVNLHLGFSPKVPGAKNGETEHQFLNVGMGVHCATVLGFLDSLGVKYDVAAY
jgi:hypothetical protein